MKIAFNIFYGVFIGLLVIIGVLFVVSIVPVDLGIETKIVQSGSMEPAIPIGALVILKPSDVYQVGDVITFGEESASAVPTTHRIIGIRKEGGAEFYTTKGDANEEDDAREVAAHNVVGKVYVSVPYAGFVLNFARQPLGFALLIALPAVLVILAEFAAIVQEVVALWKNRRAVPKRARHMLHGVWKRKSYAVTYVRLFKTDDVFVPVRIFEAAGSSTGHRSKTLSSTAAVFALVVLTWYGTSGTLSFFRDEELSSGNTFAAGTWTSMAQILEDFSALVTEPQVLDEEISTSTDTVVNEPEAVNEPEEPAPVVEEEETASEVEDRVDRSEEREGRDTREERDDVAIPEIEANAEEEVVTAKGEQPTPQEETTPEPTPEPAVVVESES